MSPPFDIARMRAEMGRLMDVMLERNVAYINREAELEAMYPDQPLKLRMVLTHDYQLNRASGAAKTCAALITALAAAISAEVTYAEHRRNAVGGAVDQPHGRVR